MTQTAIVCEVLKANPNITIEGIVRYGLEKHGIVIREHTIYNCIRKMAREEELAQLRKKVETLEKKARKGKG